MKKQFGIAMIALSAAMALTFTACGDDSSSGTNDPKIVNKVDDLSEECEDGEEALVGTDKIQYTCTDGMWTTEAKSSSSKVTSSSEKEECNPDLENCDEEKDENKEEEVEEEGTKPSKGDSGSGSGSGGSGSGDKGGSGSGEEGGSGSDDAAEKCGDLWCGPKKETTVKTGFDFVTPWIYGTDDVTSHFIWPTETEESTYLDNVIKEKGAIEGQVSLDESVPNAYITFVLAKSPAVEDISSWEGLCLEYQSETEIIVSINTTLDVKNDKHYITLPKTSNLKTVNLAWKYFGQFGFGNKIPMSEAIKSVSNVLFFFNGKGTFNFKLTTVGKYGTCGTAEEIKQALCDGFAYNPSTQMCSDEGIRLNKCETSTGTQWYDQNFQLCEEGILLSKCESSTGTQWYDPSTDVCHEGKVMRTCGTGTETTLYDPAKEFCYNGDAVYNLCNGLSFDPFDQVCKDGKLMSRCDAGTQEILFNPETHFCATKKGVYPLCKGKSYKIPENSSMLGCGSDGNYYYTNTITNISRFLDIRDGTTYSYKTVGGKVWMTQDLLYATDLKGGSWCGSTNCNNSRFYSIGAATNGAFTKADDVHKADQQNTQGICPNGWHIAQYSEWNSSKGTMEPSDFWNALNLVKTGRIYNGTTYESSYGFYYALNYSNATLIYQVIKAGSDTFDMSNPVVDTQGGVALRCIRDYSAISYTK